MLFSSFRFDQKRTRLWVGVQVILLSLIAIGAGLLCTERYWLAPVVSFLLSYEQSEHSTTIPMLPGSILIESTTSSIEGTTTSLVTKSVLPSSMTTTTKKDFILRVPRTVERGHSVIISWQLPTLPAGSSIGFFINGVSLLVERPLTLKTVPLITASGSFTWDGERYGCDPLDTPTYCTDITTGEYTITARVYDKLDVSLIDGDVLVPLVHDEKLLYMTGPVPLSIGGLPGNDRVDTFKQVIANTINTELLKEANPLALWDSTATEQENRIKPYIQPDSSFTGPDAAGKFCMDFVLTTPFAGRVKVCGPDAVSFRDIALQFAVTGEFTMAPGVLSFPVAKERMLNKVWLQYQHRVAFRNRPYNIEAGYTGDAEGFKDWINVHPDADTYLSADIADWAYHTDGVGYWVFKVHATKIGSADVVPDSFSEMVTVRVDNNANVCVAETYDYRNHTSTVLDIHKDPIVCPL